MNASRIHAREQDICEAYLLTAVCKGPRALTAGEPLQLQ